MTPDEIARVAHEAVRALPGMSDVHPWAALSPDEHHNRSGHARVLMAGGDGIATYANSQADALAAAIVGALGVGPGWQEHIKHPASPAVHAQNGRSVPACGETVAVMHARGELMTTQSSRVTCAPCRVKVDQFEAVAEALRGGGGGSGRIEHTPAVCSLVHYVSHGTPGGEYEQECRAAIVTDSDGIDERVGLAVFNPGGLFFNTVHHDAGTAADGATIRVFPHRPKVLCGGRYYTGGTWHWPAEVTR